MGNSALHAHLRTVHAQDVRQRNEEGERNRREDLIGYSLTKEGALEIIRSEGAIRIIHLVDGGSFFYKASCAAGTAKRMNKTDTEASDFVGNDIALQQRQYGDELLAGSARDDNNNPLDRVVFVNDHPTQRPAVKEATGMQRASKGPVNWAQRCLMLKSRKARKARIAKLKLEERKEYRWTFNELEYAPKPTEDATAPVQIQVAEHEAEPAMYTQACAYERHEGEVIVIHGGDADHIPGAVAARVDYIIARAREGWRIYRMRVLRERLKAKWPFEGMAQNCLAMILIGNDYTKGLAGVGPATLVGKSSLVEFVQKDWGVGVEERRDPSIATQFATELNTAVRAARLNKKARAAQPAQIATLTLTKVDEIVRVMSGAAGVELQTKAEVREKADKARAARAAARKKRCRGNLYFKSDEAQKPTDDEDEVVPEDDEDVEMKDVSDSEASTSDCEASTSDCEASIEPPEVIDASSPPATPSPSPTADGNCVGGAGATGANAASTASVPAAPPPPAPSAKPKRGWLGLTKPYGLTVRMYADADSMEGLVAATDKVNAAPKTTGATAKSVRRRQDEPRPVPVWAGRKFEREAREAEVKPYVEGDEDDEQASGGGRNGVKHILAKSAVSMAADMAFRDIVGTTEHDEDKTRPHDVVRAATDACRVCLSDIGQVLSHMLPRVRAAAAGRNPTHKVNRDLGGGGTEFATFCRRTQACFERLDGQRAATASGRRTSARGAAPSNTEKMEELEFDGATPTAEQRIKFLEDLATITREDKAFLEGNKMPLFVFAIIKDVHTKLGSPFPDVPQTFFDANYKQTGRAHNTAAKQASPRVLEDFVQAITLDPINQGKSLRSQLGSAAVRTKKKEPPAVEGVAQVLENLGSANPASVDVAHSLTQHAYQGILDRPLGDEPLTMWKTWLVSHLSESVRTKAAREVLEGTDAQLNALAMAIADAVDDLGHVLRLALRRAYVKGTSSNKANNEPPTDATLRKWISEPAYAKKMSTLIALQESWLVQMGKRREFAMHSPAFILDASNIHQFLHHGSKIMKHAVHRLNDCSARVRAAADAARRWGDNVRERPDDASTEQNDDNQRRVGYERLRFVDVVPNALDTELGLRQVGLKSGLEERLARLLKILTEIVPPGRDAKAAFSHASAAIFHVLFRLPDEGRLLPSPYAAFSAAKVNFLMLNPARMKNAGAERIGRPVAEVIDALLNGENSDNAKQYGNLCNWASKRALKAFASSPILERQRAVRGGGEAAAATGAKGVHRIEPVATIDEEGKLAWVAGRRARGATSKVQSIKWAGEPGVVVGKIAFPNSRQKVLDQIAPHPPSVERPAKPENADAPQVGGALKKLSLDALPPGTMPIGVDPGQHHAFVMSILPPIHPSKKDQTYAQGTTTIRLCSRALAGLERAHAYERDMYADVSPVKQLLYRLEHVDTARMTEEEAEAHSIAVDGMQRRWDLDDGRCKLVFRQQQQRDARMKATASAVMRIILDEAKERGASCATPLKVIVANGNGLTSKRTRNATGSDQRQVPLSYVYQALQAAPELDVVFVDANEAYTSQTCPRPSCRAKCVEQKEAINMETAMYVDTETPCYRVLRCTHCGTVFERDYVGATNIAEAVLFNLLTGRELFDMGVEEILGLGMRETHKKAAAKAAKRAREAEGKDKPAKKAKTTKKPRAAAPGKDTEQAAGAGSADDRMDIDVPPVATMQGMKPAATSKRGGRAPQRKASTSTPNSHKNTASSSRRPIGIDGNCGYRSIAQLVGGDQDKYAALRDASVEVARTLYPTLEMVAAGASTTAMLAEGMQNGTSAGHDLRRFSNVDEFLDDMAGNKQWLEDAHCVSVATALQQVIFVVSNEQVKGSMKATDMLRMTAYYPFLVHELELDEQQGVTGAARKKKVQDIVERLRVVFPVNPEGAILIYNITNTHFEVECPKAYKQVVEQHSAFTDEVARLRVFESTQGKAMGGETSASGTPVGCMCARVFHLADDPNWSTDVFAGEPVFKNAEGRTG